MSLSWKDFQGVNAGVVLELYDRFLADPQSVDDATRTFFESFTPPVQEPRAAGHDPRIAPASDSGLVQCLPPRLVVGAVTLAQSIRRYGHLAAVIDPLGSRPLGDPALVAETHGVSEDDLRALPASL